MRIQILLACLALVLTAPLAEAQKLSGQKTLTKTSYGVTSVTDPVRAGRKAQRFEVRAGDCAGEDCNSDRERALYTIKKAWHYGTPQWIGFSIYLPSDFQSSARVETTFAILHQRGGPTNRAEGFVGDPPVAQLVAKGEKLTLVVHFLTGDATNVRDEVKVLALSDLGAMRGRWTDILLNFDTSGGHQLLEAYLNGKRKVALPDLLAMGIDATNLPVYQREAAIANFVSHHPKEYYFQYGLYRAFVSRHGGPMPTQVAFFDEMRMGRAIENTLVNEAMPVD
jgi:hypothetical protein